MLLTSITLGDTEFLKGILSLRKNLIFGMIQKLFRAKSDEHILESCSNAKTCVFQLSYCIWVDRERSKNKMCLIF